MRELADLFKKDADIDILDVGSYDPDQHYRNIFEQWNYIGADIVEGPNVDEVISAYNWDIGKKFDVIISGQCIEHVQDMKQWILDVSRHIKQNGIVYIVAPWAWKLHGKSTGLNDCWRIMPDGMSWLLKDVSELELHQSYLEGNDCVGLGSKGDVSHMLLKQIPQIIEVSSNLKISVSGKSYRQKNGL
jgi:hypothetical protein